MSEMLLFELMRVALGDTDKLSHNPSEQEWTELFLNSKKQAVAGVAFTALEKLSTVGQKPPLKLLYEWIGLSEQIKNRNALLNKRCGDVSQLFANAGFRTCILKGQGNANMYPEPLLRTSGDIDVWVEGERRDIRNFVLSKCKYAQDGDVHIELPLFDDVSVEVHYIPSFNCVPKYDKRLQQWFQDHSDEQFSNKVALMTNPEESIFVPTTHFNAVQQMSHIMAHFFVEGIGLRQFVDYFYVLKRFIDEKCSEDFESLFGYLGILKFARGVMWIEKTILGLDNKYLLVKPDAIIGKVILKEIEEGGNFGFHDQRYSVRNKGVLMRGLADTYRLLKLFRNFPEDTIWKVVDKVKNQRWKLKQGC